MNPYDPRQQLETLESKHLLRRLAPLDSAPGIRIVRDGRELWNFASNDYLGLSSHPEVSEAFIEGIRKFGTGSTASRLVTGTSAPHTALEETLACAKSAEAALTFTSGYATALSAVPVIVGKGDFVVLDKLAHACLIDAAKNSVATLRIFPHNNVEKLDTLLTKLRKKHSDSRILVITESVFSMDGDLCPLRKITEVCANNNALLLLDEAHATGVLGATGMGLAEELGLRERVDFQMGTFSKALGLSGGYLAASRAWIDLIVNRARPFIYTTAPPPALAIAASAAIALVRSDEGKSLRKTLFANLQQLKAGHPSPIVPLIYGSEAKALDASASLLEKGFLIPAIRYPTVPRNSARLRLTVSAAHPPEAIAALSAALGSQGG
ncbi:MAG: 8-amino-7-oxononanoate synthase [Akkermansiaceae bacterium]|jgi:8-amino-7-oxononanoate synthase|nr:8-amino-7-oxononanoate synthase [Akkermansiaceae bacterium]MDP4647673.1 8-amino-7-oxononanoate synthase [Akkermansiaceae bacterium]MDP4722268.1 8-amino-7-oxononanoate synthase [Akkermansiaceae bacterium]MDP4780308.1 8-amino-7-oxononanoate synthase [Akkermansiaceae bacterium]MDP4846208.1 8-amino-7-oxononanoate synthase [Akkermansiaceae bacterium]